MEEQTPHPAPSDRTTEVRERIAQLWGQALDLEKVDADVDFFDSGGTSLLAVRLLNALNREFSTDVDIFDLMDHCTVRELTGLVLSGSAVAGDRPAREA